MDSNESTPELTAQLFNFVSSIPFRARPQTKTERQNDSKSWGDGPVWFLCLGPPTLANTSD